MATVQTDDDFRQAIDSIRPSHQGTLFLDARARKLFDEIADPTPDNPGRVRYVDITPTGAALQAALDASNAAQPAATAREQARTAALDALRGQRIDAVLQAINDDSADIVTDMQTVNGLAVLSLAAFKPLMLRMLARQARIENRLEILFKIMSHE